MNALHVETAEEQAHFCTLAGLSTLLTGYLSEIVCDLGYTRAIHALMYEKNPSRHISQTYRGQIIRRYTLYARELEVRV